MGLTHTSKGFLFSAIAMLLGSLAGLALAEGYLRIWGPEWLKARMQEIGIENRTGIDPDALWSDKSWPIERTDTSEFLRFVPHSKFSAGHYEFRHLVQIDEFGGRSTTIAPAVDKNIYVPFMGDSFLFGLGVEDHETYTSLLARNTNYRLLNFGYPGSALTDQLNIIEQRHNEINNSGIYVFNFFTGNDYTNILKYHTRSKGGTTALQPRRGKLTLGVERLNDFVNRNDFLRKFHTVQFIKARALYYHNQRKQAMGEPYRLGEFVFYVIYPGETFPRMVELLDQELQRLSKLSRDLEFKTFFIILPDRLQVDEELLRSKIAYYGLDANAVDVALPNRVLKEKLQKYGISYVDVTPCLEEAVKKKEKPVYYRLDTHLTSYGHQVVAQCLKGGAQLPFPPATLSMSSLKG